MKNLFRILVALAMFTASAKCSNEKEQSFFSGPVEYAYTYSSDSLDADSIAKERPAKGSFRYDENDYQSRFAGKDTFTYYYSGKMNRCVSKTGSSSNYDCEDYSSSTDSVLSFKKYDSDEKILGYDCGVIEIQKTNSWVKYYYAKDLKMAPGTYRKHRSYNWDFLGEKTGGGMVLKMEHRFAKFTMHGVATAVQRSEKQFRALELPEEDIVAICNVKSNNNF